MKKGLLLSLVASTVLFAGGDIAPVEPVAEAPAAACNDFYGQAAGGIVYYDDDIDADGGEYAVVAATAVLGVSKEIVSGLTVNAEVQGAAADVYDMDAESFTGRREAGGLTQMNLGYTWANTAFKVGRFMVPGSISPLVATPHDDFGLSNVTFEGAMVANTDLPDTTVWAAYIKNLVLFSTEDNGKFTGGTNIVEDIDVFAAGFQNKSLADTTITAAGYYGVAEVNGGFVFSDDAYMVAGSIDRKWNNTDISIGGGYSDDGNDNTTYLVAGYVTQHFSNFDATLAASYSDNGFKYVKYTDLSGGEYYAGTAVGLFLSTKVAGFGLGGYGYYYDNDYYEAGASISRTVSGVQFKLDSRIQYNADTEVTKSRTRFRAVYKF